MNVHLVIRPSTVRGSPRPRHNQPTVSLPSVVDDVGVGRGLDSQGDSLPLLGSGGAGDARELGAVLHIQVDGVKYTLVCQIVPFTGNR